MNAAILYPDAIDPTLVGTYPILSRRGGGYVWDEVLEYRVWSSEDGDWGGSDHFYAFAKYSDALQFSLERVGLEEPIVLIRQLEYISEPKPGRYVHSKSPRITEWPVCFLNTPRRTAETIPQLLSSRTLANCLANSFPQSGHMPPRRLA
jgi:hypothetical protein